MSNDDRTPQIETSPIPGFDHYYASRDGSIWSDLVWKGQHGLRRLTGTITKIGGYISHLLKIGHKRYVGKFAHDLVLETFVGPCPPGLECRHLDGNPRNNWDWNLKWGTRQENIDDIKRHGRQPVQLGSANNKAILTEDQVSTIKRMLLDGTPNVEIARQFGVTKMCVSQIKNERAWAHIPWPFRDGETTENLWKGEMTQETADEIRRLYAEGMGRLALRTKFGVSKSTVHYILSGKTWKHLKDGQA